MSQILNHVNSFTQQICPEIVFDYEKNYRTMFFPTTVKNWYIYLMPKHEQDNHRIFENGTHYVDTSRDIK